MSNHQPADHLEPETDANLAPDQNESGASRPMATDLHQPDFSRLEMARARLDAAFAER